MKKSNVIGLVIGIILAIVVVSLISWFAIKPIPTIIQGEVDVTSYKVSSKLAGRIDSLYVKEGQRVNSGELLFIMSTPEVDAKLYQAEAARNAASAQSTKARNGARPEEISAAYNVWQSSRAAVDLAEKSYQRVENLYKSGVVAAQQYDEAKANLDATRSAAEAARSQYLIAVDGARREDIASASALVQQAQGAVMEVESYIDDARQYAPFDGEVSTVIAEEGELVGSGYPIITLLDMSDMWVTFNIKEDLLPKIKVGTEMTAYVPGLGKNIRLKVYYMAVQAEYATWAATKTRGEFDIRTFEVRTRTVDQVEGLRPGMTVAVNWDELE